MDRDAYPTRPPCAPDLFVCHHACVDAGFAYCTSCTQPHSATMHAPGLKHSAIVRASRNGTWTWQPALLLLRGLGGLRQRRTGRPCPQVPRLLGLSTRTQQSAPCGRQANRAAEEWNGENPCDGWAGHFIYFVGIQGTMHTLGHGKGQVSRRQRPCRPVASGSLTHGCTPISHACLGSVRASQLSCFPQETSC